MNKVRIEYSIGLMREAKNFNIQNYQEPLSSFTIEELHERGASACFGGYIALSPRFQADGGSVGLGGSPNYKGLVGPVAIAAWLDIDVSICEDIIYSLPLLEEGGFRVTPDTIIAILQNVLEGGE